MKIFRRAISSAIIKTSFAFRLSRFSTWTMSTVLPNNQNIKTFLAQSHPNNNIPIQIIDKIGTNLHLLQDHPICIIKNRIEEYCNQYATTNGQAQFSIKDGLPPIVDTKSCFDDLLVAPDHVSRRPSDTYYATDTIVLRTHTSAHQSQFIASGERAFLCTGDVYRRDEIDASHYPVFHQMEGVRIFHEGFDYPTGTSREDAKKIIEEDLKRMLTGLAKHLFGEVEIRWREDYFPFTVPSFELDVFFNNDWMEVLGCGVIHDQVMANSQKPELTGWAFGLGLERLAMVLFSIPDIRLFWSQDERFKKQFKAGKISTFIPYSKYPFCYKDVSFWLPDSGLHPNDVYELIRNIAGDIVERVELFDQFQNKKTGRTSHAYRVTYRSMDRSLTNEEVDVIQDEVRNQLATKLKVDLR